MNTHQTNHKKNLLIIGTLPNTSGIGGVTIHIQRLLEHLNKNKIKYTFVDYRTDNFINVLKAIANCHVVHIHISNIYYQLLLILVSRILFKKSIVTIHGNIGRYNKLRNGITNVSIRFCSILITLNSYSYEKGIIYNKNTKIIPAFIPPIKNDPLPLPIQAEVEEFKNMGYEMIFSTNAYALSFDCNSNETYGITELLSLFEKIPKYGLIFSDPSYTYVRWLTENHTNVPPNVLIINGSHSFYEIIKISDAIIRNTSTDGDSLSVKEALFAGKKVICTDVVPRPEGCYIYPYKDTKSLEHIITTIKHQKAERKNYATIRNGADDLISLYRFLLKDK